MTAPRDERRLQEAFAELGLDASAGEACPAPEQLWAAAHGELTPMEVQELTDHLIACGACTAVWRSAVGFGPDVHAAPGRTRSTWPRVLWPVAASLLLIVGGMLGYRLLQDSDPAERPGATAGGRQADLALAPHAVLELQVAAIRVPAEYALVWRGAGEGQAFLAALAEALAPYRAGDYGSAAARLTALAEKYPDLPEPWFYLGVAELMNGRAPESRTALARARPRASGGLASEIEWYSAVADERAGQPAAAQARLKALCAAGGQEAARACAGEQALSAARGR